MFVSVGLSESRCCGDGSYGNINVLGTKIEIRECGKQTVNMVM